VLRQVQRDLQNRLFSQVSQDLIADLYRRGIMALDLIGK
jgi:hypothetical protein